MWIEKNGKKYRIREEEKGKITTIRALGKTIFETEEEARTALKLREMPKKGYDILLVDPPWRYDFPISNSRKIENQYPTLSIEEICALKVPAKKNALLFLWVPVSMVKSALTVMDSWGFEYVTSAVWDKTVLGMGFYFRLQHELLYVARKGYFPTPLVSNRVSSVIQAPRGKHSEKPKIVYKIIEQMYPHATYIELFCREEREGWDSWGDEI